MKWYKIMDGWAIDIPNGLGIYTVRRKKGNQTTWVAFRNKEPTCIEEGELATIKKSVERVILATANLRRRK